MMRPSAPSFTTPRQAVDAMVAAGARFRLEPRPGSCSWVLRYRVDPGGDARTCAEVLRAVRGKPVQFRLAFRTFAEQLVDGAPRKEGA